MHLLKILLLAVVQGLAELLPVSSSAHVVVAEKLLGLDPSSPQMTLVLVMLHTGTMFAVIVYFWPQWRRAYFASADSFKRFAIRAIWASFLTALIGYPIMKVIEHALKSSVSDILTPSCSAFHTADIESLFSHLELVAPALFVAGLLILWAGLATSKARSAEHAALPDYARSLNRSGENVTFAQAGWMGAVQGLCLPFRGFSRSGATISTGLLTGSARDRAEKFSFALAVILTPPAIAKEALRLLHAVHAGAAGCAPVVDLHSSFLAAGLGMVFSFLAGLAALRWLSSWLESGKWYLFGIYCLIASCIVFYLHHIGY
jgi:undecaprenyl-diphosphatase